MRPTPRSRRSTGAPVAAAHIKTGGEAGKFFADYCELGVGIPAVISTAIERVSHEPFVCHAIYTSTETFAALPDAVKTGEGGCTIKFTPPQVDQFGTVLAEPPELHFSLCTIKNIESGQLWRDGEAAGRGKAIWRLVKHERTTAMAEKEKRMSQKKKSDNRDSEGEAVTAQTFMFRCESTLTTESLKQLLPRTFESAFGFPRGSSKRTPT